LIEAVKQHAFYDEELPDEDGRRYGRTAYVVTPDVDEVTALFHLLARYVVHTDPTSIVEELLPVAVPVYSRQSSAVSRQQAARLVDAQPSSQTRTDAEVKEVLGDALAIKGLDDLLENAVETRRRELVTEREHMREQMERQEGSQPGEWLAGIDDLAPGSFDLLTATVLFPA
jgi:hypothetical protein